MAKNYGESECLWCENVFIKNTSNKKYCTENSHIVLCRKCGTTEYFNGTPKTKGQNKDNPSCVSCVNEEKKAQARETKLKKYGDPNFNNVSKREQTMVSLYGAKTSLESPLIREKIEKTMVEKYGGKVTKTSSASFKNSAMRRCNATGTNFEKSLELTMLLHNPENMSQWLDNFLISNGRIKTNYGEIAEYFGSSQVELSHWFSKNPELKKKYIRIYTSFLEEKVVFFLNNLDLKTEIIRRTKILNGYEIDVYLPDFLTGFEINDFATHSRDSEIEKIDIRFSTVKRKYKFGPEYHDNKTRIAQSKDINLVFLWEDEIRNQQFNKKVYDALYG